MKKLLTILILFSFVQVKAQICPGYDPVRLLPTKSVSYFTKSNVEMYQFYMNTSKAYFKAPSSYTSIAIDYPIEIEGVELVIGNDTFKLSANSDITIGDDKRRSNLIIPIEPKNNIYIIGSENSLKKVITIYLLDVPQLGKEIIQPQPVFKRGNCPEPSTVSYTMWREGLDPPIEGRTPNQVEHLVIHHSAGSNANTDYAEVMRNIYVFHTEVNGWDDIGYNYVVAPDGTIFLGRESQGVADHDNILGAHFCGKNTGTMGVCMMGTFTSVTPTNDAINALTDLLTWKAEKEHIYPFGQSLHPSSGGSMLANIAGHRDGCATECPGTMIYNMLPTIRDQVLTKLEACGVFVSINEINSEQILIYPNPSSGLFTIEGIKIGTGYTVINSLGQTILKGEITQKQEQLNLTTGLYFFITDDGYRKKLVVN